MVARPVGHPPFQLSSPVPWSGGQRVVVSLRAGLRLCCPCSSFPLSLVPVAEPIRPQTATRRKAGTRRRRPASLFPVPRSPVPCSRNQTTGNRNTRTRTSVGTGDPPPPHRARKDENGMFFPERRVTKDVIHGTGNAGVPINTCALGPGNRYTKYLQVNTCAL
jgi:hypothetical protein